DDPHSLAEFIAGEWQECRTGNVEGINDKDEARAMSCATLAISVFDGYFHSGSPAFRELFATVIAYAVDVVPADYLEFHLDRIRAYSP
ncbi:MAG TPA: hypothetical protein VM284_05045, partial [Candidatus Limnocylindria bacterium]|nr:hypothetical protein [Candidatus Limnocylindria bacterium]